jgi:hypothetical protein
MYFDFTPTAPHTSTHTSPCGAEYNVHKLVGVVMLKQDLTTFFSVTYVNDSDTTFKTTKTTAGLLGMLCG